jgi:carbon storage regulator
MVVLSRKLGEKVIIGDDITITVVQVNGNHVQIGIDAPDKVCIQRAEILRKPDEEPADSAFVCDW